MNEHIQALMPVAGRLPAYLKLAWELARQPRLGRYGKGLLAAGAIYSASPIDLVPGFIPVVGQLDDVLVLLYAVQAALDRLPPDLRDQHLSRHSLTTAQLSADLAVVRAALKAALAGAARLAGRAAIWGTRAFGSGLTSSARGAAALGRQALGIWRKRQGRGA